MKITLTKLQDATFEARNEEGATLRLEAGPDLGGTGAHLRPMQAVLAALAGCSAIDVVMILNQQKEPLAGLVVEVDGTRADTVPKVFTEISLRFVIRGPVAENKARRAVQLSMDKYCSVAKMLAATATIRHEVVLEPAP